VTPPSRRTVELLTLLQAPGIGPARALRLLTRESNGSPVENARSTVPLSEAVHRAAVERAEQIIATAESLGIAVIGFEDDGYPPLLRQIPDPPPILYVRGRPESLAMRGLAVVGTRRASGTGSSIARSIGRYLAKSHYSVVSGLALGIDTEAHAGALDEHGITIAVLAHGLDSVSPAANRGLAERMLEFGGALTSEHPPGTPPYKKEFVRRNRIQSGLSLGSIVVESGVKGGAIHQARFTSTQKRHLFTIGITPDGGSSDLDASGAEYLVETFGATMLTSIDDLRRELAEITPPDSGGAEEDHVQTRLQL
jgi:DNA processing protein